jgi:hypothetical protein
MLTVNKNLERKRPDLVANICQVCERYVPSYDALPWSGFWTSEWVWLTCVNKNVTPVITFLGSFPQQYQMRSRLLNVQSLH